MINSYSEKQKLIATINFEFSTKFTTLYLTNECGNGLENKRKKQKIENNSCVFIFSYLFQGENVKKSYETCLSIIQEERNWKIKNRHRFSIFVYELKIKWTNDPRTKTTACCCLVRRPHYSAQLMRFGSRGQSEFATEMP